MLKQNYTCFSTFKPMLPLQDKCYKHFEQKTDQTFDSDSQTARFILKFPILRKLEILSFPLIFFLIDYLSQDWKLF